jgi:hypothetical protein
MRSLVFLIALTVCASPAIAQPGTTYFTHGIQEIMWGQPKGHTFKTDADIRDAEEELQRYKSRIQEVMTPQLLWFATRVEDMEVSRILKQAQGLAESRRDSEVDKIVEDVINNRDRFERAYVYYLHLFQCEKLRALNQIFANDPAIFAARLEADEIVVRLGSLSDVNQRADKKVAEALAAVKMYPARQTNAVLEADFLRVFKSTKFGTLPLLRLVLSDDDWTIQHHEITGIITGRVQTAQFAVQESEGKCRICELTLIQEFTRGSFRRSVESKVESREILCGNVK